MASISFFTDSAGARIKNVNGLTRAIGEFGTQSIAEAVLDYVINGFVFLLYGHYMTHKQNKLLIDVENYQIESMPSCNYNGHNIVKSVEDLKLMFVQYEEADNREECVFKFPLSLAITPPVKKKCNDEKVACEELNMLAHEGVFACPSGYTIVLPSSILATTHVQQAQGGDFFAFINCDSELDAKCTFNQILKTASKKVEPQLLYDDGVDKCCACGLCGTSLSCECGVKFHSACVPTRYDHVLLRRDCDHPWACVNCRLIQRFKLKEWPEMVQNVVSELNREQLLKFLKKPATLLSLL